MYCKNLWNAVISLSFVFLISEQEFQNRLEKFLDEMHTQRELDSMFLPIIYTIEVCHRT